MEIKLLEIRDRGTRIPAMATRINGAESPIIRCAGYGREHYVLLTMLSDPRTEYDVYGWGQARTMPHAHQYLLDHWDEVKDGQVLDVRVILGETTEPATAECVE